MLTSVNDILGSLIEGNKAAIAIATEEYLEIHRLCDLAKAPRTANDEKLSASQRVHWLLFMYQDLKGNRG